MKQSKTSSSGFSVEETIESLRKQLAEKDVEIQKLALDCLSADGQAFDNWVQLAASHAREQQLRKALIAVDGNSNYPITIEALALPQDTTALEALIAKAGEVMRERCAVAYKKETATWKAWSQAGAAERKGLGVIRALPAITLSDLK